MSDRETGNGLRKYLLSVGFTVSPVQVEVEAESLEDAWARRFDLAASAEPVEWEVRPHSIEALDDSEVES